MPGAKRVAADAEVADSGGGGAVPDEVADGPLPEAFPADGAVRWHPGEERSRPDGSEVEPGAEGADRIGGGVQSGSNAMPTDWPCASWSVLDRRMVTSSPSEAMLTSARWSAAISLGRSAPA